MSTTDGSTIEIPHRSAEPLDRGNPQSLPLRVLPLEKGVKKSIETCFPPFSKEVSEGRRIMNILGFTLVELIVVITILTILGTIAFLNLGSFQGSTRDGTRVSDTANLSKGLDIYQIKNGSYPIPMNAVAYTGGLSGGNTIQQGTLNGGLIGFSVANPVDPLTKTWYIYSVLGNGSYYQIGAELESPISGVIAPVVDQAYADGPKTAFLKGNYSADPSLPSLIVIPGSVPSTAGSGGVFSPEVCFVTNGSSTNTVSAWTGNCVKKKDVSLKGLDSSLVGYWDMETYYQATYSGISNVVFVKDLSGNGYDMAWRIDWTTFLQNTITASGSIFSSGGAQFDNNTFKYDFATVKTAFSFSWRTVNPVSKDIFLNQISASWSVLIPWITFKSKVIFNRNLATIWNTKRILTWSKNNSWLVDVNDVSKSIDASPLRFTTQNNFHSYILPYNNWAGWVVYGSDGLTGCGGVACSSAYTSLSNPTNSTIDGYTFVMARYDFQAKELCEYMNGQKYSCAPMVNETIQRVVENGYKAASFNISSYLEPFAWSIVDVSIYNRALSDSEIRQQAKAAGF